MKWLNDNFDQDERSRKVHFHMKNGIHNLMFRKVTSLNIICFPLSLLVNIGRVLTSRGVSPYKRCNWLQVATSLLKTTMTNFEAIWVKRGQKAGGQAQKSQYRSRKRKSEEEGRSRRKINLWLHKLFVFILATLEIIFVQNGEIGICALYLVYMIPSDSVWSLLGRPRLYSLIFVFSVSGI